ncbi:MAG TPA: serine/threonine-protein kinase [Acidimicrobiia bacterium]|nr:serine/threonine-protein kinase [Acidimicrobiia bacterium]
MTTQIAEALPSYEVGDELGRGAMGVVLAATHRQLERAVAIKQLPPTFAVDPDVRRRFGSEAKTLAALSHPHIVPVYDYVEREGLCVLVMESLPGGTLWHLFTTDGLTMPSACAAILATCAGLDSAHAHGVLHRDIKPENLMFAADRTLKVTDFGIAQVFGGEETVTTVRGTVIGTPAYMAPEQAEGLNLGPAADVYAAGTVLYELLSGTLPFSADGDPLAVLESRVNEEPTPLSEAAPGVPEPLTEVTMRAIRRDPAERYPRAEDFGVAVGRAATAAFGEGWLGRADVTLRATGSIAAAAGPATRTATATSGGDGETTTAIAGRAGTGTVVTGSAPGSEAVVKVRATAAHHAVGEALADLQPEDLVRVDDLISPPKRPVISLAAAAVLAIAALICAIFAVGSRGHSDTVRAGVITVAGTDIGSSDTVHADLGAPIPVRIQELPSSARRARFAQIGFSAVGIGLGSSRSAPLEPSGNGAFTASVDAERVRILSSGELTGEFRLLDENKRILLREEIAVDPDQPFFLSATGVSAILLALFVIAYGLAITQPLRRGYTRRSAYVTMAFLGAAAGFATVLGAWALGSSEPSLVTFVVVGALGAAAFGALNRSIVVLGRRRRLRRAEERAASDSAPARVAA